MNHILEIIATAKHKNKTISICINKVNWNKRLNGYVKSIESTHIMLLRLNRYGQQTGVLRINLDSIVSVEYGSSANNDLELLSRLDLKSIRRSARYIDVSESVDIRSLLIRLIQDKIMCSLFFDKGYLSLGIIQSIDEKTIYVRSMGFCGEEDGISVFSMKAIRRIRYNTNVEIAAQYLYDTKCVLIKNSRG